MYIAEVATAHGVAAALWVGSSLGEAGFLHCRDVPKPEILRAAQRTWANALRMTHGDDFRVLSEASISLLCYRNALFLKSLLTLQLPQDFSHFSNKLSHCLA